MLNMSGQELQNLATMLDGTNRESKLAYQRPASQTVGYSLAESESKDDRGNVVAPSQNLDVAAATPASIAVPASSDSALPKLSTTKKEPTIAKGNEIWTAEEVASITAKVDTRTVPEYEILYKQKIGAEDVYLGMDFTRDSSLLSCEGLVVRTKLPLTASVRDIEVEVESQVIHVRTKEYKLRADLPETVVEKKGAAKWDPIKHELSVTVTILRTGNEVKVL